MAIVVGLALTIFVLFVIWLNMGPKPPKGACEECGAKPGEECDRWTHNGV